VPVGAFRQYVGIWVEPSALARRARRRSLNLLTEPSAAIYFLGVGLGILVALVLLLVFLIP